MKTCRYFRPRLALWAGGDLNSSEAAVVQGHLAVCPTCGDYLQRVQQARSTLEQMDPEPTYLEQPRSLWPAVSRRINAAAAAPTIPIYRRKWTWGVAAACLLLLTFWTSRPQIPTESPRVDPNATAHPGVATPTIDEPDEESTPMSHGRGLLE